MWAKKGALGLKSLLVYELGFSRQFDAEKSADDYRDASLHFGSGRGENGNWVSKKPTLPYTVG